MQSDLQDRKLFVLKLCGSHSWSGLSAFMSFFGEACLRFTLPSRSRIQEPESAAVCSLFSLCNCTRVCAACLTSILYTHLLSRYCSCLLRVSILLYFDCQVLPYQSSILSAPAGTERCSDALPLSRKQRLPARKLRRPGAPWQLLEGLRTGKRRSKCASRVAQDSLQRALVDSLSPRSVEVSVIKAY